MSWKNILEITQDSDYELPASNVVQSIDARLNAIETFLAETEALAASDPSLDAIRTDIEATYQDTLETLDYIGQQDLGAIGEFHAVGALANISSTLNLIIEPGEPTEGWGPVADFYRAAAVPESEEALAIEDPAERDAYISERRQAWAEGRMHEMIGSNEASNAFVEASIEHRKAEINPTYTPDPARNLESIAGMNDEGRKMMTLNVYDKEAGVAHDPIDYEALILYKNLEAMDYSDATDNAAALLSPELQAHLQETNMNIMARAFSGEYGDKIRVMGFQDQATNVDSIPAPRAMGIMINRTGTAFNPIRTPIGAMGVSGVEPEFRLENEDYVRDFLADGFRDNKDNMPQYFENLSELVEQSNGERIPTTDIYAALGKDPAGPDYSLPPAREYSQIQNEISRLEERMTMLEDLVANPTGKNFQDVMAERDIIGAGSLERLLTGLKDDIGSNDYDNELARNTFQEMYDAGNYQARFEAMLGVPIDESHTMKFDNSPLLQALNTNFQTFHPADANAQDVPQMRDGSTQLGEALTARNGAVILDNHTQAEPLQFLQDSLPEIASRGSTKILLENTVNLNTRTGAMGMVILNQNDPLEDFYETGDPSYLDVLKNGYALQLERIAEVRDLTPEEQSRLDEMHLRDDVERQLIEDAYTQYGIKFEFYGSGIEGVFADEFGMDARLLTTNYGWDEQIRTAGEGVDNVIVLGGGAHFVDNIAGDRGDMVLDESLGYPTFSLANPDALLRGQGDYNLSPTESGRWVDNNDPLAVQPEQQTPDINQTPSVAPITPGQP